MVVRRKQPYVAGVALVAAALATVSGCASTRSTGTASSAGAAPGHATTAPSVPSSAGATPGGSGLLPCRVDQLELHVKQLPGAAAGRTFIDIIITDTSDTTCSLTGSVRLKVTDAAHHPIPIPVSTFPGAGAATVTLRHGDSAAQTLAYGSDGVPAPGQTACGPAEAYFEISAPGVPNVATFTAGNRGACPHDSITLSNLVAGNYSPPF